MFSAWLGSRRRGFGGRRSGPASTVVRFAFLAFLAAFMLVLVAPGCGRSSLESDTIDSSVKSPKACGPSTCPNGCCDSSGTCRSGGDVRACGSVGGKCSDCVANGFAVCNGAGVCGRDDAACSASTCAGCCALDEGRLRCLSGTEPAACGAKGTACSNCGSDGRACNPATRVCGTTSCNAATCQGCCVGEKCLPGTVPSACGASGGKCSSCATGQTCETGGGAGGRCEGTSTCGPGNCDGCCTAAGQCVTGTDSSACGGKGVQCSSCGATQVCDVTARVCRNQVTCGPSNCAGCCVGNQCVDDPTPAACGTKGEACKTCGSTQLCGPAGTCVDGGECNPGECPSGCCVGSICAFGTQDTACGTDGDVCQNCASQGLICDQRICQPKQCNAKTCPDGCCSQNVCVAGTQDESCGAVGSGACADCTTKGQVCQGRACHERCGPDNCDGCCASDNTCQTGTAAQACGADGSACANCSATNSFCNGLVSPRRCNDRQSTCPATFRSCPSIATIPPLPTKLGVCPDLALAALAAACVTGPESARCQAVYGNLPLACRACLVPFHHPFIQNTGVYVCAASQGLTADCRHALGCAEACALQSCTRCSNASEDQCYSLVNGPSGQCHDFDEATSCADSAINAGLCSPFSYANYGQWIRGVGDHFCGNGP